MSDAVPRYEAQDKTKVTNLADLVYMMANRVIVFLARWLEPALRQRDDKWVLCLVAEEAVLHVNEYLTEEIMKGTDEMKDTFERLEIPDTNFELDAADYDPVVKMEAYRKWMLDNPEWAMLLKQSSHGTAKVTNVRWEYTIGTFPIGCAEQAMNMLADAQRCFGAHAGIKDQKFAATHTPGVWSTPDEGIRVNNYGGAEFNVRGVEMIMVENPVRVEHAKFQGQKVSDLGNACKKLYRMMINRFPDESTLLPEGYRDRGVRIPGRRIPVHIMAREEGAYIVDCPHVCRD